jgi:hypothetical protein
VAAAVREFNDLAVPGLGGVWFGKQLMLATLGVHLVERVASKHISNITMANAVEALACGLTLQKVKNGSQLQDPRLRGSTKLRSKTDFSFKTVSKAGFYVTQPMRMATVQTLPAMGLVTCEGSRFNAFSCTEPGKALVISAIGEKHLKTLTEWVSGTSGVDNQKLQEALSPLETLPADARRILQSQLQQGSSQEDTVSKTRRKAAFAWVESIRQGAGPYEDWSNKPPELDGAHWNDLQVGALFFATRDAAINVLNVIESHIYKQTARTLCLTNPIPEYIVEQIDRLRKRAKAYTTLGKVQEEAKEFCGECLQSDNSLLLVKLVGRDGRVLQLRNGHAVPGPAFKVRSEATPDDKLATVPVKDEAHETIRWPDGISHRVENLFLLNADLQGDMSRWIKGYATNEAGEE